jgi:hypothetical protein
MRDESTVSHPAKAQYSRNNQSALPGETLPFSAGEVASLGADEV